ncbi:efflux RND transporter periplasmic adaptor subunit [Pseudomonas mosselii]
MKNRYWIAAGTSLSLLAMALLPAPAVVANDAPAAQANATPVAVARVQSGPMPQVLSAVGTLEAVHQVNVSPEVGGRITALEFTAGKAVAAGQVLVKLNDAPERGELAKLQAQAKNAKLALERTRKVLPLASTQAQLDQAQANYDQLLGEIAQVQAQIAQKTIRAPFAGVLGIRKVNLGQYVSPGDSLVTLTELSRLHVNFPLPEQSAAALQAGQAITLKVDAWPQQRFVAAVTTLEPQIDPGARSMQVQATFDNPGQQLKPGMFANVSIELPSHADVLSVPETAISYSAYGNSLYVLREKDGALRVEQVFVKLGARRDDRVVVLDALTPGDRVVVSGQIRLSNGMPVRVTDDTLAASTTRKPDLAQQ